MFIRKAEIWTKTLKVIWEVHQSNSVFKFTEWWKSHICREFVPHIDDRLAEKRGAHVSTIRFLKQLVPVASSLRYSREFKEIICVYDNEAKNNFIAPYEVG